MDVRFSELASFTEKQWEATRVADAHRYTLFGGSRGPGKSHWLRWYLIYRLLRWAAHGQRGVHVGMFCEDYPSLKDRQISKLAQFPAWLGTLKTTKADGLGFHLKQQFGGGVMLLRNLDDTTKYQSVEFAGMAIDELTKNPPTVFDQLRGSLRWPGIDDTFFVAATNPNGRYFQWVRDYWVEQRLPENLEPLRGDFAFIQALPSSNPYLDASYWQELNTLPTVLRAAWRDGDWYAAVEGLVLAEFNAENLLAIEPDMAQPYEIAIDDGYIDPRATLFIQRTPTRVLVFDELYQTRKLEEETIRDILLRAYSYHRTLVDADVTPLPQDVTNEALARWLRERGVALPDVAAVSHEATALRRRLREADIPARNWMSEKAGGKGTSTRGEAIKFTRGLIRDGQGLRLLVVHPRCRGLIEELTAGYRNKPNPAGGFLDEPEDGNDHACDALTSWVWMRMRK